MMRFILLLILTSSPWLHGEELSIEDISSSSTSLDLEQPQVDLGLMEELKKLEKQRDNTFIKPAIRPNSLVFMRLSNTFIKHQIARDKKSRTGYVKFLRDHRGDEKKVQTLTQNGALGPILGFTEQSGGDESKVSTFLNSMIAGFIYQNQDFPLFYPRILKAYENDEVSVRYPRNTRAEFGFPRGKILAYLLVTRIQNNNHLIVVSAKSIDLDLSEWLKNAEDSAFFKFFVFDHQRELLTTTELKSFHQEILEYSSKVRQLQNAVSRTWRTGRDNWFMQDSGKYVDYDKRLLSADNYRYKTALFKEMENLDTAFNSNTTRKHVALIFGRRIMKDAYLKSARDLSFSLGLLKTGNWRDMVHDQIPSKGLLEPMTKAQSGLNALAGRIAKEEPQHRGRLQKHLEDSGLVTLGYLDAEETMAYVSQ
jgi:hypothetical protein